MWDSDLLLSSATVHCTGTYDGTPPPGDALFFPRAVSEHKKLEAAGLV